LDPNYAALHHIRKIFPRLADANVKGGIFTEPQIRVMLASRDLEQTMTVVERNAWEAFRMVPQSDYLVSRIRMSEAIPARQYTR
jgi:hypothetical protein